MAIARPVTSKATPGKPVPGKPVPGKPVPGKPVLGKPKPAPVPAVTRRKGFLPFVVGLLFPLGATLFDIAAQALPFSLSSVVAVQRTQPLHWLLDLVPLVMWLVAGRRRSPSRPVVTTGTPGQERHPVGSPLVLEQTPQQHRVIATLQAELATVKSQLQEAQARELAAREALEEVTARGTPTVPGLFAESPRVVEETEDDLPDELPGALSLQSGTSVAFQEPVETRADLPSDLSPAGEIIDLTEALAHIGGDEELLMELATLFLGEYPHVLENLRAAVTNGNAMDIMYHAHALRGAMSNFVTHETENAARRLEQFGREGNIADSAQALRELEMALQRLIPALHTLAGQVAA